MCCEATVVVGIGVDLVNPQRVARELAQCGWRREDGVFTEAEIGYCHAGRRPAQRFAQCFAAKEATLKALGVGAADCAMLAEVEVARSGIGESVRLHGGARAAAQRLGVRQIKLSTSVTAETAAALVVLEA